MPAPNSKDSNTQNPEQPDAPDDAVLDIKPAKLSRKERRIALREIRRRKRGIDRNNRVKRKSLKQLARENEKGLTEQTRQQRKKRSRAKDVYNAIGFDYMFEDGTCQVEDGLFSQTLAFSDISYQAARDSEQKALFNIYSQIFDYCDSSMALQLNVINSPLPDNEIGHKEFFKTEDPALAPFAAEYNRVLNQKMLEGVSNLSRERYLTFSTAAPSYVAALPQLATARSQLTEALNKLGCNVHALDGAERINLICTQTRPGAETDFSYEDISTSMLSTKDFVCPEMLDFKVDDTYFKSDAKYGQVLCFKKFGSRLTDTALSTIIDLQMPMNVCLHIQPLDKGKSLDYVKGRLGWIDKDIIEHQRKAVQKGFDYQLLPQELAYAKNEAEELLSELNYQSQNLFLFTGLIYTYADDVDTLQNQCLEIINSARKNSIDVDIVPSQQREALNSVIPVGNNHMHIQRYLTTAQVAMMMPFATQEINDPHGGYYGQNKVSNNLIMLDRKKLAAPMGFAFGTPGSGKSFAIKREITNTYLQNPNDEFIIIDPNNEYPPLVEALGGEIVSLSPNSSDHINLFDIYPGTYDATGEDPVSIKTGSLLAIAEEVLGRSGAVGTSAEEKSIIDRAVKLTYAQFENAERAPQLGDFYDILRSQPEPAAENLARAFELYVTGSLNYFNHQTTVDINKRITAFSFKQLGQDMKTFAMLIILDFVYNRMLLNFERGITTWVYIDEVQSLFTSGNAVFEYFDRLWSEGRKYNLIPTGISQLPERIISHDKAKYLLSNSDFLLLLKQSDRDRITLTQIMGLSPQQASYIDRSIAPGEGLLVAGSAMVPFKDDFPKGKLYDLWNTKPDEMAERKRAAWMRRMNQAHPSGTSGENASDEASKRNIRHSTKEKSMTIDPETAQTVSVRKMDDAPADTIPDTAGESVKRQPAPDPAAKSEDEGNESGIDYLLKMPRPELLRLAAQCGIEDADQMADGVLAKHILAAVKLAKESGDGDNAPTVSDDDAINAASDTGDDGEEPAPEEQGASTPEDSDEPAPADAPVEEDAADEPAREGGSADSELAALKGEFEAGKAALESLAEKIEDSKRRREQQQAEEAALKEKFEASKAALESLAKKIEDAVREAAEKETSRARTEAGKQGEAVRTAPKFCPECGVKIDLPDAKFCPECGTKFE
jgi:type IV secretory pathway VirB4 component